MQIKNLATTLTLLVVLCSCATNPGRIILPESKSLSVGLSFSFNSELIPGLEVDIRKRFNDSFESGARVVAMADIGGYGIKLAPYGTYISKTSNRDFVTLNGEVAFVIHQEPSEGKPIRMLVLPGVGSNYIHKVNGEDEISFGLRYDQAMCFLLRRNPYQLSPEYLGVNFTYLNAWNDQYLYNGIDYFFPKLFQYEVGWGGWI